MYGGSKKAAVRVLDRAIELYQNDNNLQYQWGHAEAYMWRGLALTYLGKPQAAQQDWQAALQIAP